MKYVVSLGVVLLLSSPAVAQHGGFSAGSRGGGGAHGGFAGRHFGPGRPSGRFVRGFNPRFGPGFYGDFYSYGFPLFGDDCEYPYDFGYPPEPTTVIQQPLPPPVIFKQAPTPAGHPVTHEYATGAASASTASETTFVIALKDGSQTAATAVWVQQGAVHFIDADDRPQQIPLASVDRNLTRKLNQEKNLDLRLPFE